MKYIKYLAVLAFYFFFPMIMFLPYDIIGIDPYTLSDKVFYTYIFITDFLFIILMLLIYNKTIEHDFKDFKKNNKKYIDTMIKVWLGGLALMSISSAIISGFSPVAEPENEEIIKQVFTVTPLYIAWSTIIYAPLVEELIFRKTIRGFIKSKWAYIIISGLIFGAIHTLYNAENLFSYLYIIPYSCVGLAFGYIYEKTNNIFSTIIMHLVHNGILIGIMFLGSM